ncbi:MAG TPA: hypothetical protein HPP56_04625 [Nitrospirae bacterium]|nr:hypothetical protein [Nitrospirota bacterium]
MSYDTWQGLGDECLNCHSDIDKMKSLGYPQFITSREDIEKQTKHKNIHCQDCHLGDARAKDKDKAHKGMLKAFFVSHKGTALTREDINYKKSLLPEGKDYIRMMLPIDDESKADSKHPEVRNVLWHDRDRDSFNFSPEIVKKTCGKSNCHPQELKQFNKTIMGTNFRQRTMQTWLQPYGPHNCGPSFADTPVQKELKKIGFDFKNTEKIQKEINLPFSHEQAKNKQRFCNVCHAGCLDCHYEPNKKEGVHNFVKKPSSMSCAGYGRGTSICHPGAMQSRRGETYIGGDYSIPTGMEPDSHYKKGIHCIDCHHTGREGMGDMVRKAGCQDCHVEIEEAHSKSIHKNLDCATCHVNELRGYQLIVWGPGYVAEQKNPFKKYSLYYGIQSPPILMKDKKGKWMPIKVMPHTLGNFSKDVPPSGTIKYRWDDYSTRDAYYILGTFETGSNNKHLLWLDLQQASHPYGKARKCASCHAKSQEMRSKWEYMDDQGTKEPFVGSYKVIADQKGLIVRDFIHSKIKVAEGYKLEDFASWIFFKDKWVINSEDFHIKTEKRKYDKYLEMSNNIDLQIKRLDKTLKNKDKKTIKRYKELRGIALHNQDEGLKLLPKYSDKDGALK